MCIPHYTFCSFSHISWNAAKLTASSNIILRTLIPCGKISALLVPVLLLFPCGCPPSPNWFTVEDQLTMSNQQVCVRDRTEGTLL